VKTSRLISLILILLLFACFPKKPEIPLTEVAAGPLLQALKQRRQSFGGLKAVASVQVTKWGRKRTFDTVGIVLDGQRRLRMEAYGPLGQTIIALVWDGKDVLLHRPDNDKVERQGQAGLDQILGQGLDMQEFCALLSGNVPELIRPYAAVQFCGQNGDCVLEVRHDDSLRRAQVQYSTSGSSEGPRLVSQELSRSGKLMYEARFDRMEQVARYRLPMKIEIENPNDNLLLTIEYSDVEMNAPIGDEAFMFSDGEVR